MDFYEDMTNTIVEKIRSYNSLDSDSYGVDYQYRNYESIDQLIADFKNRNSKDKDIIYEDDNARMWWFKDYVQEFVAMVEDDFLPLDGWMLHYILTDDGASYSLLLRQWIFPECCDRAKEILKDEFNDSFKEVEIESTEEDYDEGFDELE